MYPGINTSMDGLLTYAKVFQPSEVGAFSLGSIWQEALAYHTVEHDCFTKVNLPHAIDFRTTCGANLVT